MKAVLTPAAQPCRYPCPTLGAKINVLVSAAASNKSAMRPPLPPPVCGGEWKERGRKLVGRDKGSLTEQQTEGNMNKQRYKWGENTRKTDPLSRTAPAPHAPQPQESIPAAPPPPLEPSVMSHGMEYRALFGQVGSAPTPRLCPFLESGEN